MPERAITEMNSKQVNETTIRLNAFMRDVEQLKSKPVVDIVHFVPDERKSGGGYQSVTGSIKTISLPERMITLNSGQVIHFDDILDITGTVFSQMPEE